MDVQDEAKKQSSSDSFDERLTTMPDDETKTQDTDAATTDENTMDDERMDEPLIVKKHKMHHPSHSAHKAHHQDMEVSKPLLALVVLAVVLILFNQVQIGQVSALTSGGSGDFMSTLTSGFGSGSTSLKAGEKDLSRYELSAAKSTGHTLAEVFPVEKIKTQDDAMAMIFPTGTPPYGEQLGVSFDDPVNSLAKLANAFPALKEKVKAENPEAFKRYINLASNPYGVSCEYCCGVGPIGADKNGESRCGCQHNPAVLTLTLYLAAYSDYNDAEILREVLRWKTIFFPKNMIELATTVAGGDTSSLDNLPGMVGGC